MSNSLVIPPRPDILIELQVMMKAEEPDIPRLTQLIKSDVALYTILLSIVNSPLYRRSQAITSIEQALMIMGVPRVFTLLQAVMLRSSLDDCGLLEDFWSTATEVATLCSVLAERFIIIDSDLAYSVGMLHAAGIPVMLNNFPHYRDFISQHGHLDSKPLCYLEREHFSSDHCHQGHELAQAWHMSDEIALAVRYQPITLAVLKDPKHLPSEVPTLLALLKLAKALSAEYRQYWRQHDNADERLKQLTSTLQYLQISEAEFLEVREAFSEQQETHE